MRTEVGLWATIALVMIFNDKLIELYVLSLLYESFEPL